MKVCRSCGQEQPQDAFGYWYRSVSSRRRNVCRACMRALYRAYDRRDARRKLYRQQAGLEPVSRHLGKIHPRLGTVRMHAS